MTSPKIVYKTIRVLLLRCKMEMLKCMILLFLFSEAEIFF